MNSENVKKEEDFALDENEKKIRELKPFVRKPSLLFITFNKESISNYKEIFQDDYILYFAANLNETINVLSSTKDINIIIIDMSHYFKIISTIKSNPDYYDTPIIVAESFTEKASIELALKSGIYDVWHKPMNKVVARYRVRNLIYRRIRIDSKSGVFSQENFLSIAEETLKKNPDKTYYLIRFDIDNFKIYNHNYGIEQGDALLNFIGQRCLDIQYPDCFFSRAEKDNFIGLIEEKIFKEKNIIKYFTTLKQPFHPEFQLSIRMGIYKVEDKSLTIMQMSDRALIAHSVSKSDPLTRYAFYDDSMLKNRVLEQQIIDEMEDALKNEDFVVYLQPQYNQANMHLYGAEALVRWIHPKRGMISPGVFIPIFEKTGFIMKLDKYVFTQVCKMQRQWIDQGINVVSLSVNLSRAEVQNENLCEELVEILNKFHLSAKYINLEITESAYLDNPAKIIKTVNKLREIGFEVEMDDFGSGYSSLNTLKEIPVDVLKLDLKFLYGEDSDSRTSKILSSIIRMAHGMRMPLIAEGVETKEQADYLKSLGLFYIQGYFFDKPLESKEFENRLKNIMPDALRQTKYLDSTPELDLIDSQEHFKYLLSDFMGPAGILEYDGEVLEGIRYNNEFSKMMDVHADDYDIYQSSVKNGFDAENYKIFEAALKRAIKTKKSSECDVATLNIDKRNRPKWLHVKFKFLYQHEYVYTVYATARPIDAEKEKDIKIENLKRDIFSITDSLPGGAISILYKDDKFSVAHASESMANMLGFSHKEYMEHQSKDLFYHVYPEDKQDLIKSMHDAVNQDEYYIEKEFRLIKKSGETIKVHLFWKINQLPDGSKCGTAVVIDYGERTRDFEHIKKLEKNNTQLKKEIKELKKLLKKGENLKEEVLENNSNSSSKDENQLNIKQQIILDKKSSYSCAERFSAQTECREIEFTQRILKFGIFKYSYLKDKFTFMSESLPHLFGYTREEFFRKFNDSAYELIWKPDREKFFLDNSINHENYFINGPQEFRVQTKNGDLKWIRLVTEKISETNGAEYYLGIMIDIDAEKENLKSTEAQQAIITALENNVNGGTVRYKITGKRWIAEYISPKFCELLGYKEEILKTILNDNNFAIIHPEDVNKTRDAALAALNNQSSFALNCRLVKNDGSIIWISSMGSFFGKKEEGYFILTSYDISKQKHEEIVRYNEKEQFNALIEAIPGGIATFELKPDKIQLLYATPKLYSYFNLTQLEFKNLSKHDPYWTIFESDRESVKQAVEKLEKTGKPFELTFRVKHRTGVFSWVTMNAQKTGENNGNPVVLTVFQNQTTTNQLLYKIFSKSEEIVIVYDKNTKDLVFANKQAEIFAGKRFNTLEPISADIFLYNKKIDYSYTKYPDNFESDEYDATRNGRDLHFKRILLNWNNHEVIIVFARDISKQNQKNRKIYELIEDISGAFAIFKICKKGYWERTYVSKKAQEILKIDENSDCYAEFSQLIKRVHPDDVENLTNVVNEVSSDHETRSVEYRLNVEGDKWTRINLKICPVEDDTEGLLFYGIYKVVEK